MESVLAETIRCLEAGSYGPQELEALLGVVRTYDGQSHTTRPLVTELIGTLLDFDFPDIARVPALKNEIAAQIAKSLLDDPHQSEVLQRFLVCLCERPS
jgi:hypothetical protein